MFRIPRHAISKLGLLLTPFWLVGCYLFSEQHDLNARKNNQLPPIPVAREAMQLEFVFIQRPESDPLLGKSLWRDIDQVSALSPEIRSSLIQNGFRIGHVGSTPPRTLQTLLSLTEAPSEQSSNNSRQMTVRRFYLQSGAETEIQASGYSPEMTVDVVTAGESATHEFQNARCVFRVTAERIQDGWAKLQFQPEIHYDAAQLRPTATESDWQLRPRQKLMPFFDQRFSILLNVGEMAILSADSKSENSLGRQFFVEEQHGVPMQRLLVVRLANMKRIEPVYAETDQPHQNSGR